MLLDVSLPPADSAFRAGSVAKWHVNEGDPVNFGTILCDVAIDEFAALQRTKRASLLGSTSKLRQRRVKDGIDHREGRGQVVIRLISVETGMTVKEIAVPDGGRVEIGDLLARLGSGSTEDDDQTGEARLSVDFPDAEEIDPFE
jgi:multidrug efflux pump subunit AcrA (membrane-fusion protein)